MYELLFIIGVILILYFTGWLEIVFYFFMILPPIIWIILIIGVILSVIVIWMDKVKERKALERLRLSGINEIDYMSGRDFEIYLSVLFKDLGYQVQLTKASGDYGADLILKKAGETIAVQAKRYSKNVGVKSVQEIASARLYYSTYDAWVVTNSYYTSSAIQLANRTDVKLIDRDGLVDFILESKELHNSRSARHF